MEGLVSVWIECNGVLTNCNRTVRLKTMKIHLTDVTWEGDDPRFEISLNSNSKLLQSRSPWENPLSLLIRITNCTLGYKLNFDLSWPLGGWVLCLLFWLHNSNESLKRLVGCHLGPWTTSWLQSSCSKANRSHRWIKNESCALRAWKTQSCRFFSLLYFSQAEDCQAFSV